MTVYGLIQELITCVDNPDAEVNFYDEAHDKYMRFEGVNVCSDNYSKQQYVSIDFS